MRDSQKFTVRTLLLTDLVDSTRLIEELGDSHAADVSFEHERMARDLLAAYDGFEIDKADGFLIVFERPVDALLYAVAYQRGLKELAERLQITLEARVGIHLGEVILRENAPDDVARGAKQREVEGLAKPIAARIMSLAHGGQILISRGAFDLAQRAMLDLSPGPHPEITWLTHGSYRFKGIEQPMEIFEAGEPGIAPLKAPPDSEKAWLAMGGTRELRLDFNALRAARRRHEHGDGEVPDITGAVAVLTDAALRRFELPRRQLALVGALLVGFVAAYFLLPRLWQPPVLDLEARGPLRVALTDLEATGAEGAAPWLLPAVQEILAADLGGGGRRIDVVSLQDFDTGQGILPDAVAEADVVIDGVAEIDAAERFHVGLSFREPGGKPVKLRPRKGKTADLLEMTRRLSHTANRVLAIEPGDEGSAAATALTPPAAELYAEGLAKLRRLDARGARKHLEEAMALAGSHPLVQVALAEALAMSGQKQAAASLSAAAVAASARLPRWQRLYVHARDLETRRRWRSAAALFSALWNAADHGEPVDRLDLGLRTAVLQARAGWAEASASTLAEARREAAADELHVKLAEADAARYSQRYEDQLAAARSVAAAGEGSGEAVFLVARARYLEGLALKNLGRLDAALAALEGARDLYAAHRRLQGEAEAALAIGALYGARGQLREEDAIYEETVRLFAAAGNEHQEAVVMANRALNLQDQGDLQASYQISLAARERLRRHGDQIGEVMTLLNLAAILDEMGRFEEALEHQQQAAALAQRAAGGYRLRHWTLQVRGRVLQHLGRLSESRTSFEESMALYEAAGDTLRAAGASIELAAVLLLSGELEAAGRFYEESLPIFRAQSSQQGLAAAYQGLGQVRTLQDDLQAAESSLREALRHQADAGKPRDLAATRLELARLNLYQGDARAATALARDALGSLEATGLALDEAAARLVLARCLAADRRLDAARSEVETAQRLVGEKASPVFTIPLRLVAGEVLTAAGETAAAREELSQAQSETTQGRFRPWSLEAQLLTAVLDAASGNPATARAKLERLEHTALDQGFGLIARRAAQARDRL